MAKKQENCNKECKSGKSRLELGKELCPNAKEEKIEKNCNKCK